MANRIPKTPTFRPKVKPTKDQYKWPRRAGDPPHAGYGHTGPNNPDKGLRDGSCNRTACQRPLKGQTQYSMRNHMVENGKFYYCEDCAASFTHWDHIDRPGEPVRCTLVTEDEA
jgi:hypothetical protein